MFRLRSATREGFARMPACVSSFFANIRKKRSSAKVPRPHAPKARSAFLKFNMFLCLWMRVGKNKLTPVIWKSPSACFMLMDVNGDLEIAVPLADRNYIEKFLTFQLHFYIGPYKKLKTCFKFSVFCCIFAPQCTRTKLHHRITKN